MIQEDLFSHACIELKDTSSSDANLTVITSMDETGQTLIEAVTCNVCDVMQPVANFAVMPSGEIKRKCKSCKSGQKRVVKKLRSENPYPSDDYCCPICERDMKEISKYGQPMLSKWVLDHCHETNTFRGWLCSNCNTGLGGFKDDKDKVLRAYEYLKGHEE